MKMHQNRTDMPPFPNFVKIPDRSDEKEKVEQKPENSATVSTGCTQSGSRVGSLIKYINLPEMMKNSDAMLLLGLILLLSSESADEKLILALAYILL